MILIFTDIILNIFSSVCWDFIDPIQDQSCMNLPNPHPNCSTYGYVIAWSKKLRQNFAIIIDNDYDATAASENSRKPIWLLFCTHFRFGFCKKTISDAEKSQEKIKIGSGKVRNLASENRADTLPPPLTTLPGGPAA